MFHHRSCLAWLLAITLLCGTLFAGLFPIAAAGHTHNDTCVQLGDVTQDGDIDIDDILAVRGHMFGLETLTGKHLLAADITQTGVIDIDVILAIRGHIFGTGSLGMSCEHPGATATPLVINSPDATSNASPVITNSPDATNTSSPVITNTPGGPTASPPPTNSPGVIPTHAPTSSPFAGVTVTPASTPDQGDALPYSISVKMGNAVKQFLLETSPDFKSVVWPQSSSAAGSFGWIDGTVDYFSFRCGEVLDPVRGYVPTNPTQNIYIYVSYLKIGDIVVFDCDNPPDDIEVRPCFGAARCLFMVDGAGPGGKPALVWYFDKTIGVWNSGLTHLRMNIPWPDNANGNITMHYRYDTRLPDGVAWPTEPILSPEVLTSTPEPSSIVTTLPTFNRMAVPKVVEDYLIQKGIDGAYKTFVDAIYARQATITLADLGLDSPNLFKQVVQTYMNYNPLRHFFTNPFPYSSTPDISTFTPAYRYDATGTNSHFARINAFTAKVNNLLPTLAPVGANELDRIIACHLYITNSGPGGCTITYGDDSNYSKGAGGGANPMPYQDAYMGLMGNNNDGRGYVSCCGFGELDAFLMIQCGIDAIPMAGYNSESPSGGAGFYEYNDPSASVAGTLSGGHGVCSFMYRGKYYMADPSEGRDNTRNSYGDLLTLGGTYSDLNYMAFVRGDMPTNWAPLTKILGAKRCTDPAFSVFRYQAINTGGAYNANFRVSQNFTNHTVQFPVRGNPSNTNQLFWCTFSTETDSIVGFTPQF